MRESVRSLEMRKDNEEKALLRVLTDVYQCRAMRQFMAAQMRRLEVHYQAALATYQGAVTTQGRCGALLVCLAVLRDQRSLATHDAEIEGRLSAGRELAADLAKGKPLVVINVLNVALQAAALNPSTDGLIEVLTDKVSKL